VLGEGLGGSRGRIYTAALVVNLAEKNQPYTTFPFAPQKLVYAILLSSTAAHC